MRTGPTSREVGRVVSAIVTIMVIGSVGFTPITSAPGSLALTKPMFDVHYAGKMTSGTNLVTPDGILKASLGAEVYKHDRDAGGPGEDEVRINIASMASSQGKSTYSLTSSVPWSDVW